MNVDSNSAMLVVLGIAGYRVLDQVIGYFFRKLTKDDYVTKKDCEGCGKHNEGSVSGLKSEISIMKGLLLVIAVKGEVTPEQLAQLTK